MSESDPDAKHDNSAPASLLKQLIWSSGVGKTAFRAELQALTAWVQEMTGKLQVGEFKGTTDVPQQPSGGFLICTKPASAGTPWQFPCLFQESQPGLACCQSCSHLRLLKEFPAMGIPGCPPRGTRSLVQRSSLQRAEGITIHLWGMHLAECIWFGLG